MDGKGRQRNKERERERAKRGREAELEEFPRIAKDFDRTHGRWQLSQSLHDEDFLRVFLASIPSNPVVVFRSREGDRNQSHLHQLFLPIVAILFQLLV